MVDSTGKTRVILAGELPKPRANLTGLIFNNEDGYEAPIRVSGAMNRDSGYPREFESLSPDGSRLVFRTGHGGVHDQGELRVAVLNSRNGHPVVRSLVQGNLAARLQTFVHFAGGGAAWSRDNRHVAFPAIDTTRDQHLQVYVADAETGDVVRWTNDSTWKFSVAWSPDGRGLAVGTGDFASQTATVVLLSSPGSSREFPDEGHLIVKRENIRRFWNAVFGLLGNSCRSNAG